MNPFRKLVVVWIAGLAATLACIPQMPAAVLSVDIGPAASPVAPGFVGVSATGATVIGPYTVNLGGNPANAFFDTVSIGLTNMDPLLRDFVYNNNQATGGGIDLSIAGLSPNTAYNFTGYSYQDTQPVSLQINAGSGTTGLQATIGNNGGAFTAASPLVQATGVYTTDASGVLNLVITGLAGNPLNFGPRFNGFVIDAAIPEPTSLLLFTACALGLIATYRSSRL